MNPIINTIHNVKSEDGIPMLKQHGIKVDCIITSPPYNVDLGNNKYNKNPYDLYKDNLDHTKYINWLKSLFNDCQDILNIGGSVCINIGDGKNGAVPTHSDIIQFMTRELNYVMMTTIIWEKNNVANRTSWGSWMSPSCPSFPTPYEFILVFRYGDKYHKGDKNNITVTDKEFKDNSLSLWRFAPENLKKIGHPAAFPQELPKRLIQQLTYKNDIVLDIFSGSGTTAMVAKQLGRNYIGFEMSENYYNLSLERIASVQQDFFLLSTNKFATQLF